MPACRDNRKRQQKRRHRDLLRLAARQIAYKVYQLTWKPSRYYRVKVYGRHKKGKQYRCKYYLLPRQECVETRLHLMKMVEYIPLPEGCLESCRSQFFLDAIYDLGARRISEAATRIFDTFDRLIWAEHFDLCDQILAQADLHQLPSELLRSLLTATVVIKDKLPSRPTFYAQAYARVEQERGKDVADDLLGWLE